MTRTAFRPDPHLAIDRLARLRARLAELREEEAAARDAVLALPDGIHEGLTTRARIVRDGWGTRRVHVAAPAPPDRTDAAALPAQPDSDGALQVRQAE
jgi:hypothetical protein